MIANLRRRIIVSEIVGITLNPDDTSRRHGIQAYPLTAASRSNYSPYSSSNFNGRHPQALEHSRIKEGLKRVPLLRSLLRAIRICVSELAHTVGAASVARRMDYLVVTGGGALDEFWGGPWGHPWNLFKWGVLSRICRTPYLFVSVGKCQLQKPLSRFFVRVALRLADYRSYRDPVSKIGAQALLDVRGDPVFPDLAFSYPCPVLQPPRHCDSHDGRLLVGVSPMAYCDPRSWPLKDERRYAAYISQLAEMVKWLLIQGHRILFFTTDGPDAASLGDLLAIISCCPAGAGAIQTLPSSTEQSVDSFLKDTSRVDLTIASRLHGIILSHLNATPVLALSFDPKVDAHMNAIDQKEYCFSIDHWEVETLIARFNALKNVREREQNRLRSAALRFRRELDMQYDRILGPGHASTMRAEQQIDNSLGSGIDSVEAK